MILFLDFDGVLHPDPCPDSRRLFENAPRLSRVLEHYPEVGVVLSTSWRNSRGPLELLAPLPQALRSRVLGITPKFSEFATQAARVPYRRHAECEQWLRSQNMSESLWWALDDRPDWFAPYCENLLECDAHVGFDERMSVRLASTLTLARMRSAQGLDVVLA